jgi:hypothetical protein
MASNLAAALLSGEGGSNPGAYLDPAIAQAQPDLQLGQALTQGGLSTAPASPWQALARIAQAGAGQYLQRGAISDLAKAYAHSADNAAATLPEGHPLRAALQSNDPVIRMQGLQAYQKALTLMSEPSNIEPGGQRSVGSAVIGTNTNPRSEQGKLQQDIDNAGRRQPVAALPAPPATPGPTPAARPAGVPLSAPQMGGIESVTGMSAPVAAPINAGAPAGVPTTAPNFTDRFDAARPTGVQPTSLPQNPLQGAIDLEAKKAAAVKGAEDQAAAGVKFGDLLTPQPAPKKGPGGTEALTTTHGTLIPALTDQAPMPKTPAEAEPRVGAWQKTQEGWNASLQPGYQAEQRLNTIANVFKTMQTGYGAEQKAQVASLLKSIGVTLPGDVLGDPAKVETAIHENYVETLQQLKASTPRFTQMEFKALSENKEHPNLQPAANLQMLSEDIGQLRQSRDLPRDFVEAQQHGWRDPQSFEQAWLRQNPLKGYVDKVRGEIGPLKGMPGNEAGAQPAFPGGNPVAPTAPRVADKATYDALSKGSPYMAPDGSIRHKQ